MRRDIAPWTPLHCARLPRRIFLVRHGTSVWNKTKRVSGQCDPPLAADGWAQAARLCAVLRDVSLTSVYTSTLARAMHTAMPAALDHGVAPIQCDEFREQHLGIVQGRFRDERDPEAQALWQQRCRDRLNFRFPGGESYADLTARVAHGLSRIIHREQDGHVLIVGHRNTNRALLCALLGWPAQQGQDAKLHSHFLYQIDPRYPGALRTISLREYDLGRTWVGYKQ